MSSPNVPPLSRRAARQAEQSTHDGKGGELAEPLTRRSDRRERQSTLVPSVPSAPPTDVSYRTQVRPRMPHYDAAPTQHTDAPHAAPHAAAPTAVPTAALPAPPPPAPPTFAPPAYQPEQLRRRDFRPPVEQPEHPPGWPGEAAHDAPLEYRTQGGPAAADPVITEQTLSRRELRAQRGEAAEAQPEPLEIADHMLHVAPLVEPMPQPPVAHPVGPMPTTGAHWSVGMHDEEDPFENTFSRQVGSNASLSNTNALVLPEMPRGSLSGPVAGTGEIIVTGMIDVPRVVSATGAVPARHESPDIDDDDIDASELGVFPPDSAPVSALTAVSSYTGPHSAIATRRGSGNTVTVVLVATTVGMAVIAIGLFVVAALNGLF